MPKKLSDLFNPFSKIESNKKTAPAPAKKQTVAVDHAKILRDKEANQRARAAAKRGGYQGTPTDPAADKKPVAKKPAAKKPATRTSRPKKKGY